MDPLVVEVRAVVVVDDDVVELRLVDEVVVDGLDGTELPGGGAPGTGDEPLGAPARCRSGSARWPILRRSSSPRASSR